MMRRFFIPLILFALSFECQAQQKGKVVGISDGDTFILLTDSNKEVKIRLYGIDCPEHAQDFGEAAKKELSTLIFKKNVFLNNKGLDRYGRTLAIVHQDTLNVNELMLKEGYAWHYVYFDKNKQWDLYESQARQTKKGLWLQPNPIAPWIWREQQH